MCLGSKLYKSVLYIFTRVLSVCVLSKLTSGQLQVWEMGNGSPVKWLPGKKPGVTAVLGLVCLVAVLCGWVR